MKPAFRTATIALLAYLAFRHGVAPPLAPLGRRSMRVPRGGRP